MPCECREEAVPSPNALLKLILRKSFWLTFCSKGRREQVSFKVSSYSLSFSALTMIGGGNCPLMPIPLRGNLPSGLTFWTQPTFQSRVTFAARVVVASAASRATRCCIVRTVTGKDGVKKEVSGHIKGREREWEEKALSDLDRAKCFKRRLGYESG
jgi:hypothetical protein